MEEYIFRAARDHLVAMWRKSSENALYDTTVIDACHSTFVQTHRMRSNKSELQSELWALGDRSMPMEVYQL